MSKPDIQASLEAADPLGRAEVRGLVLGAVGEEVLSAGDFLAAITEDASELPAPGAASAFGRPARRCAAPLGFGGRKLALVAAVSAVAAVFLMTVGTGGGPGGGPASALGAVLARLAKVSPSILFDPADWRVESAYWRAPAADRGARLGAEAPSTEGWVQFVSGGRSLNAEIAAEGLAKAQLRSATLQWRSVALKKGTHRLVSYGATKVGTAPVLETVATIYEEPAGGAHFRGGANYFEAIALWEQDGRALEFRSYVPDLTAFRRRLGALRIVDKASWLNAMPRRLVAQGKGLVGVAAFDQVKTHKENR